jgi:lipase
MRLLICLHGNPLNGQEFAPLLPLFKEKGYQAVVHKRPIRGSKLEPLLQSISATAKVSGGAPFDLVAYSWGAYLALAYLLRYPENVSSLLLLNPLLVADPQVNRPRKVLLATPLLRTLVLKRKGRSLATAFLQKNFYPDPLPDELFKELVPYLSQALVWRGEAAYQKLMLEKPLPCDISGIKTPISLLFGEHDRVASMKTQLTLLQRVSNLQSQVIAGAGHALPWTHPTLVAAALAKQA